MKGRGPSMLGRRDEVFAPTRDLKGRAFREARQTGFLSLPARGLTEFPNEVYHLEEHLDRDEKKWECVDLVKIDMSHNAIASISDDVAELTSVTSVKLAQNKLKSLPEGFFQLTGLTYLDLSKNELEGTIPESIGNLINLKELGLAANKLQRLPETFAQLTNLEVLRLEENALTALPSDFGQLRKLHSLTAGSNQLTSLPASFAGLRSLQTLDMKKNRLETVSEQLGTLQALRYLDLRQNKLVVFPQLPQSAVLDQVLLGFNSLSRIDETSILRAKDSITVLDLRDNKLDALPVNIACLYKLKTLDLSNNDLSDLPPGLGYLKHLNHIVVDGNPLRSIRRGIISSGCEALKKYLRTRGGPPEGATGVMEQEADELQLLREREHAAKAATSGESSRANPLRTSVIGNPIFRDAAASGALDMSSSVLQTLPIELLRPQDTPYSFTTTLLHLNLSKNHLTQLPVEIHRLEALQTLTVEENQLRAIDPAVAMLPRLQLLRLRKNHLTREAIDTFLGESPSLAYCLKELDLRSNALTEMPHGIRFLTSLQTLQLAYNKMEMLDGFPFHELVKVTVISVSDNRLKSLGTIYHAPALASLSFENNNLTSVPYELGLCPQLRSIYLNGNPQKTVRGGIIAKGSLEILTYLKNKLPPNASLPPPPPPSISGSIPPSHTESTKTGVVVPAKAVARHKNLSMYAATADEETPESDNSEGAVIVPLKGIPCDKRTTTGSSTASKSGAGGVENFDAQIRNLENQLDTHALSAAKRFALKKELALVRSAKIREERRLASSK